MTKKKTVSDKPARFKPRSESPRGTSKTRRKRRETGRSDVQGQGVDRLVDLFEGVGHLQVLDFRELGVNRGYPVTMGQQEPDRLVGVAFRFWACAKNGDMVIEIGHARILAPRR